MAGNVGVPPFGPCALIFAAKVEASGRASIATAGEAYAAGLHSSLCLKNCIDAYRPADAGSPKNDLSPAAHDVHLELSFMLPERSNMKTRYTGSALGAAEAVAH